ncbi:hypothetical protein ABID56_001716 [Alkalibacillus flavidus]|uniref:rRNA methylase n=1 Tax=Alkalibacillus flavidus TaxID=546021 RepID=A0ABV2KVK5_9BACI
MKQIIPFAHDWLRQTIESGDTVVDATLGNGHDSVFLSQTVGSNGHVYSFDIQVEAITEAKQLFNREQTENVTTVQLGHEHASSYLQDRGVQSIGGAIFNLGFLPGGDEEITTHADTTIQAIDGIFSLLKSKRMIVIVVYPGHETGQTEKNQLMTYLKQQKPSTMDVAMYHLVNRSDKAPFVVGLYKK